MAGHARHARDCRLAGNRAELLGKPGQCLQIEFLSCLPRGPYKLHGLIYFAARAAIPPEMCALENEGLLRLI